ncbi:hypothetical protein JKP88DRAFT_261302 [Tribonema minus]|uniref:Uncharacterized protein n=1 Tax=Tribonema minus TaxID=303371 RepID=A0A835YWP4_9STRA|nr:hypothetical protein JKP88DRAFT_261302 [Tribonema minus]
MSSAADALLHQLRDLPGLGQITTADIACPTWPTRQRVFLCLLAEIPSASDAVEDLSRLQAERTRARAAERVDKVLPAIARAGEDAFRQDFINVVASTLERLGGSKAITSEAKLARDPSACIRAFEVLAARVHKRSSSGGDWQRTFGTAGTNSVRSSSTADGSRRRLRLHHAGGDGNDVGTQQSSQQQRLRRRSSAPTASAIPLDQRPAWQDVEVPSFDVGLDALSGGVSAVPRAAKQPPRPSTSAVITQRRSPPQRGMKSMASGEADVDISTITSRYDDDESSVLSSKAAHQPQQLQGAASVISSSATISGRRPSSAVALVEELTVLRAENAQLQQQNAQLQQQLSDAQADKAALLRPSFDEEGGSDGAGSSAVLLHTRMLMLQVAQLRRQVQLQAAAAEANEAVAHKTGDVLQQLQQTFAAIADLSAEGAAAAADAGKALGSSGQQRAGSGSSSDAGQSAGINGSGSNVASVSWRPLLQEVKRLKAELSAAQRAAARAVHSKLSTGPPGDSYAQQRRKPRAMRPSSPAVFNIEDDTALGAQQQQCSVQAPPLRLSDFDHLNAQRVAALEADLANGVHALERALADAAAQHGSAPSLGHKAQLTHSLASARDAARRMLWSVAAFGAAVDVPQEGPGAQRGGSSALNRADADVFTKAAEAEAEARMGELVAAAVPRGGGARCEAVLARARADRRAGLSVAASALNEVAALRRGNDAVALAVTRLAEGLQAAARANRRQEY